MHFAFLAAVIPLFAGCTLNRVSNPSPPLVEVAAAPEQVASSDSPAARQRLAQVQILVEQTRALVPGFTTGDDALQRGTAAQAAGRPDDALLAAAEAEAAAEAAISDHYARQAHIELARAHGFAGLNDVQLVQLRAAEEILVTGNSRLAYGRLRMLNEQLEHRVTTYVVERGDSLWVIAARPDVYDNPRLWPLLWKANLAVIPNPERLRRGQVLRLRPHPTLDEVAQALDIARGGRRAGPVPDIGPLRRVGGP